MSDRALRALERAWRASGSEADRQRWLQARSRAEGLPPQVLETQDVLQARGLAWAEAQIDDLIRTHAGTTTAWRALNALLLEAFGPLVPAHPRIYPPQPPQETLRTALPDLLQEAERQVRSLLDLHIAFVQGKLDRGQVCARLAELAADATDAEDAWYQDVEAWVLDFFSDAPSSTVEQLAELCFTSWVLREGDPTQFGNAMALTWMRDRAEPRYPSVDWGDAPRALLPVVPKDGDGREALLPHLTAALDMDWSNPPALVQQRLKAVQPSGPTRAQETYQERCDGPAHPKDERRQPWFTAALEATRAHAAGSQPLTLDQLTAVQVDLLGSPRPVRFRPRPALAQGGAEVYAWFPGLEGLMRERIRLDLADDAHPIAQAARLYLDLIYVHPFYNGNARAARLALEWVLRRAGLPTPELEPLVRFETRAGDPATYWGFVAAMADGVAACT